MSRTDVLIGEISPTMRNKLRSDGYLLGMVFGIVVLTGYHAGRSFFEQFLQTRLGFDLLVTNLLSDVLQLFATTCPFVLMLLCARLSLLAEVRYRRRHRKWRWER